MRQTSGVTAAPSPGMKPPGARRTPAWAIVVWLVAVLDALLILVAPLIVDASSGRRTAPEIVVGLAIYVATAMYGVIGALIVTRQPRNPIGWMLLAGASALAIAIIGDAYAASSEATGTGLPWLTAILAPLSNASFQVAISLVVVFIPLYFPSGTLPSRRWRVVPWYAGIGLGLALARPLIPSESAQATLTTIANIVALSALALALAAIVIRFRGGDRTQRQQIKWFAAAAALAGIGFGTSFIAEESPGWVVGIIGMALVPISIGIAVLRYRLYEIDRIISRTLSWGLVTVTLLAAFAALVVGLTSLLGSMAGGSTFAVAGSTLVVFALFQPLRARIQRAVDRRFDRARYDAERTASAFAARLRDDVDLASVQSDLLGVVSTSLQPVTTWIWVRPDIERSTT